MVTTKRGKKGQRTTVNLSASYGLQSLPKEIEMADSDLYLTVRNEAVNNYNTQNNLKPGDNLYKTLEVNPRPGQPDTDWIDLITHDQAAVQNYEVSVSSGSEKTRFYSSLGYFDQEGIILTNRFRRYSLRTNVDHDISNAFQTGVSIALSKTINNRVPNDNVGNGIFTRSIDQRRDATILRSGYISEGEQLMYARKGAVGDILGYFLQADGRPVEGLEIHRELLGVTLDELAQLPTIVGVAGGEEKAQAIYAALTGKRINGLVTEETTARAVLALAS
jgi:hypothetical protein